VDRIFARRAVASLPAGPYQADNDFLPGNNSLAFSGPKILSTSVLDFEPGDGVIYSEGNCGYGIRFAFQKKQFA